MGKFSDYASRTNRFSDSQDEALLRASTASEQNQASESAEQEDGVEEEKGQASETADQENGVDAENKQGFETMEHHDSAMFDEDDRLRLQSMMMVWRLKGRRLKLRIRMTVLI